jgi:uncharacterized protein (TIGR02145 family)
MPYNNTKTVCFLPSDFTDGRPTYAAAGSTYGGNILFANETLTLNLDNSSYGYTAFKVTFTGNVQYVSVAFLHPNGQAVSVSNDGGALFLVSSIASGIINCITYENGTYRPNEFLVVVNGFGILTNLLNIEISVGAERGNSSCVTIDYNCTMPIYSAETGLHTYSAYDAIGSIAKLKTILYSLTPVEGWAPPLGDDCEGTRVFSAPLLQSPALPYYYGIGDIVFKVGRELDRAYGTRIWYEVRKKKFRPAKITQHIDGPQWWGPYDPDNQPTSPSCVIPKTSCVGRIKKLYDARLLTKPRQYRYYMGYDPIVKRKSNDSVFVFWSWQSRTNYPILGSTHALGHIGQGGLAGMDTIPGYPGGLPMSSGDQFGLAGVGVGLAIISLVAGLAYVAVNTIAIITLCYGIIGIAATVAFPPLAILGIIIGLAALIISFFIPKKEEFREDCVNFLHHFTDTPYLSANTGTHLYRNVGNSVTNTGWHSDGVYFYYQYNGVITSKEQVATWEYNSQTNSFSWQYSIIPDSPTLVTDYVKLIVLPYVSGKPLPYCNGRIYYNELLTGTVIPPGKCCTWEVCDNVTLSMPAGTVYSCISIDDANAQAQEILNSSIIYAQNHYTPISNIPENQLGVLDGYFTHELKIESNPTEISVFFDGRIASFPQVGMKMYFDDCGCTPVLPGYYAITSTTYYRIFVEVGLNGNVTNVFYMQTSTSTTTTTGQPILTNNLDYSSNWYLYSISNNTVNYYSNYLITEPTLRNFIPSDLLNNYTVNYPNPPGNPYTYQLRKGFIKTPDTHNNFQLYNNFTTTLYNEAATGWYRPLIDWITDSSFYYGSNNRSIYVNVKENCDFINNTTSSRIAYFIFTNSQGAITATDVALTISVSIYDTNGVLINTYYSNVPSNSTSFSLPFFISVSSNVGSIVINNIQLNGSSTSNYIIGTCQTCITKICNQIWMTHNLSVKKYRNGNVIPQITDQATWTGLTTGAWCYYNNDPSTEADYGILYNSYAVTDPRGLAPTGYHVPSQSEFTTLSTCLNGDNVSGGKLKETNNYLTYGLSHWTPPNLGATDQVKFTAIPSGYRSGGVGFYNISNTTSFWPSDGYGGNTGPVRTLQYNNTSFPQGLTNRWLGFSVRLIKD